MGDEEQDDLATLNRLSKALRQSIFDDSEDDLDEAIMSQGEEPEEIAEKGRSISAMALARYWAEQEEFYKRTDRQRQGKAPRRDP
ncbi:MAG: hypothetical protein GKR89_28480 [Candidatus Latescibacteria bacterium]|nr:hypothetical protein [Candidatus Latescibacterota bacterium]